jgi:hypothetical protein
MLTFAFGLLVGSGLSCVWAVSHLAPRWVAGVARAFLVFAFVELALTAAGAFSDLLELGTGAFAQAPWAGVAFGLPLLGLAAQRAIKRSLPVARSLSTQRGAYRTAALELAPVPYLPAPFGDAEGVRVAVFLASVLGMLTALAAGCAGVAMLTL